MHNNWTVRLKRWIIRPFEETFRYAVITDNNVKSIIIAALRIDSVIVYFLCC